MEGRNKNYYEVLGIDIDSSDVVIKQAYKNKLLHNHPDKTSNYQLEINLTQDVYKVLINQETRKEYDEQLHKSTQTRGLLLNGDGLDIYNLDSFEIRDGMFYKKCPRCASKNGMVLTEQDLVEGSHDEQGNYEVIVQCTDCSLWIRVEYAEEISD